MICASHDLWLQRSARSARARVILKKAQEDQKLIRPLQYLYLSRDIRPNGSRMWNRLKRRVPTLLQLMSG